MAHLASVKDIELLRTLGQKIHEGEWHSLRKLFFTTAFSGTTTALIQMILEKVGCSRRMA